MSNRDEPDATGESEPTSEPGQEPTAQSESESDAETKPVEPPTSPAEESKQVADEEPKREKAEEKKRDRAFTLKIAIVTAVSALVGALVGGFFTFASAQLQSQRQEDTAQITMRKEEYAKFLADEADLGREQFQVISAFKSFKSDGNGNALNVAIAHYNDVSKRTSHSTFIVRLVTSPATDEFSSAVVANDDALDKGISDVMDGINAGKAITDEQINLLMSKLDPQNLLLIRFIKAAEKDMTPPEHGILDIF